MPTVSGSLSHLAIIGKLHMQPIGFEPMTSHSTQAWEKRKKYPLRPKIDDVVNPKILGHNKSQEPTNLH